MKDGRRSRYVVFGALLVGVGLLLVAVFQLNSLEKRFVIQNEQLRMLGENTERIAAEVKRLKVGGTSTQAASSDSCKIDKVLHPEVENFLKPRDIRWPPEGATTDGVFQRGWSSGDPKGFNWMIENAGDLLELIVNYVDAPLADRNRYDNPEHWHGELACRVEITDDFKEYTFYLRRGVKWHVPGGVDVNDPKYAWLKGEHELTAHDFVFGFDMLMNPQVQNGFMKNYFQDLESWKAVDDYTLVVRWKKKTYVSITATLSAQALPRFLYAYSQDGKPYPKETIGLKFNQHWYNNKGYVGVGPYRMVKYKPGSTIELERNDDYYGDPPAIQRIVYPIYTDRNQTLLRLKADELSFGLLREGQYREEVLQWQDKPKAERPKNNPFLNGKIHCEVVRRPIYSYIGWNADKPLFSDAKVRTAMTLAFRRREIIKKVFAGLGDVAVGPYLPETGYHDPNIDPLEFDLDRAKKLLTEAGWKDSDGDGVLDKDIEGKKTPFEFSLLIYGNSPEWTALANIFKEDLLKIGVRMTVEAAEWSLMQKKMDEKQFDAFTGAWLLSWDTDPYQIWHSSQADTPKGSNRVGFRNKEADKLIEKLRETFDEPKRKEMLRRVHRIIYDEQAVSFFRRRKTPYCYSNKVKAVRFAKIRPMADSLPWYVVGGK